MANDKNPNTKTLTVVKPAVTAAPVTSSEKFYKVLQTVRVPRGSSHFTLQKGRVISSFGYDIKALIDLGVPLEETTETTNPPLMAQIV